MQPASLDDIRARFISANRARVDEFIGMRAQMDDRPDSLETLRLIGDEAHRIAGVAATLGFSEMGESAFTIDKTVVAMDAREITPLEARQRIGMALDRLIETMLH